MRGLSTEIEFALQTIIEGLNYNFFSPDGTSQSEEIQDIETYVQSLDAEKMKVIMESKVSSFNSAKKILDRWINSPNAPNEETIISYINQVINAGDNAIEILRKALSGNIDYGNLDANKHNSAIKAKPFILEAIFDLDASLIELRNKLDSGDLTLNDRDFRLGHPEKFAKGEFFPASDYHKKVLKGEDVKICPFGTEGERIELQGLGIILPEVPKDKSKILFSDEHKKLQRWIRPKLPKITTSNLDMYEDVIKEEFRRRREGIWFMNHGKPVYLTGHHYFALTHCKMLDDGGYMQFRYAQLKMFYHLEACILDKRCLGQLFGKSRRTGFTYAVLFIILNWATSKRNGKFGMMSKTGTDGSEAFSKISYAFLNLPFWMRPIVQGKLDSPKEIYFGAPMDNSKEAKKARNMDIDDYLNTSLDWRNTKNGSYDSIKLDGYLFDECYSPETQILTENGFKEIKDIEIGDYVINNEGQRKRVTDKNKGVSNMYKVIQPYGIDYVVTENHKLYLNYGSSKKYSNDIFISPKEYFEKPEHRRRYFRRIVAKQFKYDKKELPLDPYILGLWLGDGLSNQTSFVVNEILDPEIAQYLTEYCDKNDLQLNITRKSEQVSIFRFNDIKAYKANQFTGTLHKFKKTLEELNIWNNKNIPEVYLTSSVEDRLKLLAGIIDSDGYKRGSNSYNISMSRKGLIDQIYKLTKELGLCTKEVSHRKTNFDTDCYSVSFTDYDAIIPCKVKRKIPKPTKKVNRRGRMYIEPIGKGYFVGITIDAESDKERLLILKDYTVSKNCFKIEKPNDAIVHLGTVTPTLMPAGKVVGKMFAGSTMGAHSKGGEQGIEMIAGSMVKDRDPKTKKTATGLYFYFLPAHENMEEFTDKYGYCHTTKPKTLTYNILGEEITMGSVDYLMAVEAQKKKQGDKAYNEQLRTYPRTVEHMMRDESSECVFNMNKLYEQLDHNEKIPEETRYTTGNFEWVEGKDSTVAFFPNSKGRFKISWMPSKVDDTERFRNAVKRVNDKFYPLNRDSIRFGCDPFSLKSTHGEGSKGGLHGLTMKLPEGNIPRNKFVVEYIARPSDETIFFEDVIKCIYFYGAPILVESNRIDLLRYMRNRGYRGFVMDRVDKNKTKLNSNEIEYGGQPMSGKDIIDSHMNTIGAWIEKNVGISTNPEFRPEGEIGDMPFSDTLADWLKFDPDKRTKYDATISSGLAIMACKEEKYRGTRKKKDATKVMKIFKKYKNDGSRISTLVNN